MESVRKSKQKENCRFKETNTFSKRNLYFPEAIVVDSGLTWFTFQIQA